MKRKKWIALLLVMCTLVGLPHLTEQVFATSADDKMNEATDKKNQAQNNLDDVNNQIDNIKDSQQEVQSEINATRKKLNSLLAKQEELEKEINDTQAAIDTTQAELEAAQEDERVQYEAMKLRIQYMYENSAEDSLWEALLKADGLADLLNRVEYIAQVHKTDRELTEQYKQTVDTIQVKKDTLLEQMETLLVKEEMYLGQQVEIEETLASLNDVKAEFASQLAAAQSKATALKQEIAKQEELYRQAQEEKRKQEEEERKKQEEALKGNVTGSQIVAFARKYVGNPYVWGGNSLTKGCDCSGFVHLVYANFGISTPRYSMSFLNVGQAVSLSEIQPGDIVVYDKKNGIGHVAIYIGNGKIVEAQSTEKGITDNRDVNCRSIAGIRRIVKNP